MWRVRMVVVMGLLCAACGGGIGSYEDAVDAQADVMEKMVDVLEGVTDEASAERASSEIEALGKRMAEIAAKVSELPRPSMDDLQEMGRKQGARMQEFQQQAAAQMMKLAEYKPLSDAWERALSNLR